MATNTNDPFASPLATSTSTPATQQAATPDPFKQAKELGESAQASAVTGTFDESKGVAGRVQQITDYGGPLIRAARTRATQGAVKLGMQNSTLAGQAGEQAVIETATPIAGADANLYQQQQLANQSAQNQVNIANSQIKAQTGIAGLQLGENSRQFGTNLLEQRRQFDATLGQGDQQFAQNLQLQRESLDAQREQFAQKLGLDIQSLQLQRDQLSQQDRQFLDEMNQRDRQLAQQETQFQRDQQGKITLAQMDADNRKQLVEIEAKYKTDIAGNENISRAWGTMMDSINQIQNNPELDQAAKQTLIGNTTAAFQSFAGFWKKVSGGSTDISDLLSFGFVAPPDSAGSINPPGRGYGGSPITGGGEGSVEVGDRGG